MAEHTRRTVLRGTAGPAAAATLAGTRTPRAAARTRKEVTGRHFPFLQGAFAPVTEELTAFDLPVTGRVPRAGPGRGGQRVARVPQIMEMQLARDTRSLPDSDGGRVGRRVGVVGRRGAVRVLGRNTAPSPYLLV
ncbi:hypothetical protein [Streptomyces sp. NPDC046759]|uniref:hypothetical protein n=1 Tax=Streptomyces sp. NPDC046759 TaxID=3155019 RepID=UPI0034052A9B